jgi:hypothetical protein
MKLSKNTIAATCTALLIGGLSVSPALAAVSDHQKSDITDVGQSARDFANFQCETSRKKDNRDWITTQLSLLGW